MKDLIQDTDHEGNFESNFGGDIPTPPTSSPPSDSPPRNENKAYISRTRSRDFDSANNPLQSTPISTSTAIPNVDDDPLRIKNWIIKSLPIPKVFSPLSSSSNAGAMPSSSSGAGRGKQSKPSKSSYRPLSTLDNQDSSDDEHDLKGLPPVSSFQPLEIVQGSALDGDIEELDVEVDLHRSSSKDRKTSKPQAASKKSWKEVLSAWISVMLALIAGSSIGPVFKYMAKYGIRPCLAASWRCQCMTVFLIPLAIAEVAINPAKNSVDWFQKKPDLPYPVIVHLLFSGLAWAANLLFWIVGLQYTSTFKASVLACCHPILLVIWMRCKGQEVGFLEYLGVFVSFTGLIISCLQDLMKESDPSDVNPLLSKVDMHHQILGYILCLLAALCEVIVLFNRIATKKYVPLMQYTCGTTIVVALAATLSSLWLEGNGIIYVPFLASDQPTSVEVFCLADNCIFGWMSQKWVWKILLFGLWVGVVCIAGFNYAMQYIPPLVFSALNLIDPALTAIISWMFGIESLPTIFSWIGGVTVMTGVGIISYAEHKPEGDEDH